MIRKTLYLGSCIALVACAAAGTSGEAPQTPSATTAPTVQAVEQPASDADPLYAALRAFPAAGSVLSALPADVRAIMDRRIETLPAEHKRALLDPAQPFAYQRPLLHLVAGGETLGAYTALFASSAAADELVELRAQTGQLDDLPQVVSAIAQRAATHVLRARAASIAPGVERKKEVLGEIAAAAEFLEQDDLYALALDTLSHDFPDPRWAFMRAGALARRLQPQQAKAALPTAGDGDGTEARAADTLIAAAERAIQVPSTPEAAVAAARAMLLLNRDQAARDVLAAYSAQRPAHLGLETSALRAEAGSGPCPGLRTPLGNGPICQASWKRFLTDERMAVLQAAWQSHSGRDPDAVDVMLGLTHVVPMMYGLEQDQDKALAHLSGLQRDAEAAVEVSPRYRGVALMASTLQSAFSASIDTEPGQSPEVPKATRVQLVQQAATLVKEVPDESWSQAAALAVVAILAPNEDATALLLAMGERLRPEWRVTHGSLLLWSQIANGAADEFTRTKGLLARAAEVSTEGSYDRSRWVLLWAEAEANLTPSDKTYGTLMELANRLKGPNVPLGLRLRTALDVAGIKARQGDLTAGIELLEPLVANTRRGSVQSRQEQELLVAATGYELVLRALTTTGEERAQHVLALDDLIKNVGQAAAAPPVLMMWLALWKGELDALTQREACNGNAACQRKADAAKGIRTPIFEKVVGPRMADMLRHGVLPIGGVELEFRYRGGRLVPQVGVDPAFLLVHMPTLDPPRP